MIPSVIRTTIVFVNLCRVYAEKKQECCSCLLKDFLRVAATRWHCWCNTDRKVAFVEIKEIFEFLRVFELRTSGGWLQDSVANALKARLGVGDLLG